LDCLDKNSCSCFDTPPFIYPPKPAKGAPKSRHLKAELDTDDVEEVMKAEEAIRAEEVEFEENFEEKFQEKFEPKKDGRLGRKLGR
jgi:hypothetical protein